jgi:hypothetical protein
MNKLNVSILALLVAVSPAIAQKLSREFGKLTVLDMNYQPADHPDAEAVILFDQGEAIFYDTNTGYDIRFTRTKRIKILDKRGVDYAEVAIPYYVDGYGKTEQIVSLIAYTYNIEDGRIFRKELDKETVFDEKLNNRWNAKKFVFPDVQEGSIIEFQYILESPFHFNLPDWEFQDHIPTVYSKYQLSLIPFYEYVFLAQGISRFTEHSSEVKKGIARSFNGVQFKDMVHTFVMTDVPAFKDESFITSPDDYIKKIDFQLAKFNSPTGSTRDIITTWKKMNKELLDHDRFGKYIKRSEKLATTILTEELDLTDKDEDEKARLVIEYVKKTFSWDNYNGKYASKKPKEFSSQKTGNAADINLFLLTLLQTADIDARPVIISTRPHGKVMTDYPFNHFFNYVIVLVTTDSQSFLTDGTETLIPYNRIPPRCINEKGLIVQDESVKWVNLAIQAKSDVYNNISISIDPKTLKAKTKVSMHCTEFEAYRYKRKYRDDTTKIKKDFLDDNFDEVQRVKTLNYERIDAPYVIALEGEVSIENLDNKLIISPFLNLPIKENKLTQKKRSYPVDFVFVTAEKYKSTIEIPEGYRIMETPDNYKMDNELAEIRIQHELTNGMLNIEAIYYFKKAVYKPHEYARIKSYFDTIVKKFNEQIVLEKI